MHVKIASRKSDLARIQAYSVGGALEKEGCTVSYHFSESLGDKNLTDPLWKMPAKGVFTEDFYQDLLDSKVDLVVHSWKDLPTEGKPETIIAATLPRADVRDLLIFKNTSLHKRQVRIFSSSPRRTENLQSFLSEALPVAPNSGTGNVQIEFSPVRGNINTRVRKLFEDDQVDGLIMAKAAWDRLMGAKDNPIFAEKAQEFVEVHDQLKAALGKCLWMVLPLSVNPTAAAQGALAIEVLRSRHDLRKLLNSINDEKCFQEVQFERETLSSFGGGCHSALGITRLSRPYGTVTFIKGRSPQGETVLINKVESEGSMPKFSSEEMWSSRNIKFIRHELNNKDIPIGVGHQLVTKAAAFIPNQILEGVTWTSGISTWKALAGVGQWVNGSCDCLGDQEDPDIRFLMSDKQRDLPWFRLTSHFAGQEHMGRVKFHNLQDLIVENYELDYDRKDLDLNGKKCFFWSSGRVFVDAILAHPELEKEFHCCGPGRTYQYIKNYISTERIGLFLNEEDWRNQCLSKT